MKLLPRLRSESGFTSVELLLACVIFPLIVVGISNSFDAVRKAYTTAKQLNEVYAVLSACPELDRALDYTNLVSNSLNCSPNNTFSAEGGSGITYTYNPTLTVTDTSSLPNTDQLQVIPDSKVVDISVAYLHSTAPPLELRMLITRSGIAQQ
jgi:hypothetical protein